MKKLKDKFSDFLLTVKNLIVKMSSNIHFDYAETDFDIKLGLTFFKFPKLSFFWRIIKFLMFLFGHSVCNQEPVWYQNRVQFNQFSRLNCIVYKSQWKTWKFCLPFRPSQLLDMKVIWKSPNTGVIAYPLGLLMSIITWG